MPLARKKQARRVSHQDIARAANISRVTVSRVLAGKDESSPETRRRVRETAERLGYRPNLLVQGLQTGRTHTVGVIVPSSMHFHAQIALGIHDELLSHDTVPIQLWMNSASDDKSRELEQIHRLVDRRVDGVIIWPSDVSVPDVHFHEIWQRNIPLVTVDRRSTMHADHVGTDEEAGGAAVAEHLLALGHRRLAHVTDPKPTGSIARRGAAFLQRVEAAGLPAVTIHGRQQDLTGPLLDLLRAAQRPTAIFAATDNLALKVYAAAAAARLRIPQDLSVAGYADFPFAPDLVPPLTSVRQDPYQMGRQAGQLLLDRIEGKQTATRARQVNLPPQLVVRESTAAAPSA